MFHSRLNIFFAFCLSFPLFSQVTNAQRKLVVENQVLNIPAVASEKIYFGLQAGDTLVFNFKEINGKKLDEIEVDEYNGGTKFIEYSKKSVEEKKIKIIKTGIYVLKLKNKSLENRICDLRVERIPQTARDGFDSEVYWKTKADTSFYTIKEDYLVSRDTTILPIIDNYIEKVGSMTSKNKSVFQVDLPYNTFSWSYYLGVDEVEKNFITAESKARQSMMNLSDSSGSALMAKLAIKKLAEIQPVENANNIQYWFVADEQDTKAFFAGEDFYLFGQGNTPLAYGSKSVPNSGTFYICLLNDNEERDINVHIRISSMTVKENWGVREIKKVTLNTYEVPCLKN